MTDTTAKPMWTRCKRGCKQRIYNDHIDIDNHNRNCPADLKRDIANLTRTIQQLDSDLSARIDDLEQHEPAEPAMDPFAIDEEDDQDEPEADDIEEDEEAATVARATPTYDPDDYYSDQRQALT